MDAMGTRISDDSDGGDAMKTRAAGPQARRKPQRHPSPHDARPIYEGVWQQLTASQLQDIPEWAPEDGQREPFVVSLGKRLTYHRDSFPAG
jgi:hypothetical protein